MSNIRVSDISHQPRDVARKGPQTKAVGAPERDAPKASRGPVIVEKPSSRVQQALQTYLHYQDGVQKEAEQAIISEMFGVDTYV